MRPGLKGLERKSEQSEESTLTLKAVVRTERVFHVGRRCLAMNRAQSREETTARPEEGKVV